ncbi:hypothetical protein GCM10023063_22370 [Arthrobacter methylotrophus]
MDHTYASLPYPIGWAASRRFDDRLSATSKKTWFPVSAQEWADSAIIEADPVRTAATVFAAATRRFAAKAKITVMSDEDGILTFLLWPMELTVPKTAGICSTAPRPWQRAWT